MKDADWNDPIYKFAVLKANPTLSILFFLSKILNTFSGVYLHGDHDIWKLFLGFLYTVELFLLIFFFKLEIMI